ncbi:hypothetical protein BB559_003056 [Furculomyces boomerangus]|uniref:Mini-chromosome maintenance complex-binding protein n=2 Tax=Harpellales TaxID=61421 RepID=A0A2T9YPG3_9FUNG|nr:hypothetical protein BB559_003056 [Furculomyces boomerangus]PVZ99539.1 hypothetical protein BB558_004467 [Smittium angustum]
MPSTTHPSVLDPRTFIQEIYEEERKNVQNDKSAAQNTIKNIPQKFMEILNNETNCKQVINYEDVNINSLASGKLVRFECMIQDPNLAKEMQMYAIELRNKTSREQKLDFVLYSDQTQKVPDNWVVENDHNFSHVVDTEVMYAISIPGRTSWLKTSNSRVTDDTETSKMSEEFKTQKKTRYPLPSADHSSAVLKFYGNFPSFKANETIEVYGIFDWMYCCTEGMDNVLWPTIQVLYSKPLPALYKPNPVMDKDSLVRTRTKCLQYISESIGKDELVATYLLLLLISRSSSTNEKAGKLSVGITGVPQLSPSGLDQIVKAPLPTFGICSSSYHHLSVNNLLLKLEKLVPAMVSVPLSIPLLNQYPFQPNAESEYGLRSGLLQMAPHTLLVVDESSLNEGTLLEQGVRNISAIQKLCSDQKLGFIYPYQQIEVDLDVKSLVLSFKRPILKTDILVGLSESAVEVMESMHFENFGEKDVCEMREYLREACFTNFSIPESLSTIISEEYAESRKKAHENKEKLPTQSDLFLKLTIARLLSLSKLEPILSKETWDEVMQLEGERMSRV